MKLEEALNTLKKAGYSINLNEDAYTKDGEEIDIKDYKNIANELSEKISELKMPGVRTNAEGVGEIIFECLPMISGLFNSILKNGASFKTDDAFKVEQYGNGGTRLKYIGDETDAENIAKLTLSFITEFSDVYKEFYNTIKTALNGAVNKLK